MGSTIVPVERKRLLGNPGKRPIPEPAHDLNQVDKTLEPWRPLGQVGRALWSRVMDSTPWLANSDMEMVLLLCETMDERMAMRLQVLQGNGGWRERVALRNLDRQVKMLLDSLGLSPEKRTMLTLGEVQIQRGVRAMVQAEEDGTPSVKDIIIESTG